MPLASEELLESATVWVLAGTVTPVAITIGAAVPANANPPAITSRRDTLRTAMLRKLPQIQQATPIASFAVLPACTPVGKRPRA